MTNNKFEFGMWRKTEIAWITEPSKLKIIVCNMNYMTRICVIHF